MLTRAGRQRCQAVATDSVVPENVASAANFSAAWPGAWRSQDHCRQRFQTHSWQTYRSTPEKIQSSARAAHGSRELLPNHWQSNAIPGYESGRRLVRQRMKPQAAIVAAGPPKRDAVRRGSPNAGSWSRSLFENWILGHDHVAKICILDKPSTGGTSFTFFEPCMRHNL